VNIDRSHTATDTAPPDHPDTKARDQAKPKRPALRRGALTGPGRYRVEPSPEGAAGLPFVLRETGQPIRLGLRFATDRRQSGAARTNARRRSGPNRPRRRTMPTMTTSKPLCSRSSLYNSSAEDAHYRDGATSITRAAEPRRSPPLAQRASVGSTEVTLASRTNVIKDRLIPSRAGATIERAGMIVFLLEFSTMI
jgi:hypothetical protein